MTSGWELVILHAKPSVFIKFLGRHEGCVEVWTKNILYWFIEGQTHFGMSRGANLSLALYEPKEVALHSNSISTSKYAPQEERNFWCYMKNNQWIIIGVQLPTKSPIELNS